MNHYYYASSPSMNTLFTTSELISHLNTNTIASCVLGINKINKLPNLYNLSHTAILLLQKEIDFDCDEDEIKDQVGILVEYENYSPDMSERENKYVRDKTVIYHYGDKGGLRYYIKKYDEFIKEFADLVYIDLNIQPDNQQTFEHFINKIAKKEENKWIKEKYSSIDNFNCQTFSIEALKELKPHFNLSNIYISNTDMVGTKSKKKLDILPLNIRSELLKYYRN